MNKAILRSLGAFMLLDGLATLLLGRKFVRLFRFGQEESLYRKAIDWMLGWPTWQLRVGAASEAAFGAALLSKAPLSVDNLYGNVAGAYAAIDPGWRTRFYPHAHSAFDGAISRYLPHGGHVLDLGSGVGANLSRLLNLNLPFGTYTGVDLTPAMLALARERYGHVSNARFLPLDLITDPLPEGPFDLITSTWVFEHLPDPVGVAQRAWERLKPGGYMVLLFEVEADSLPSRLVAKLYSFLSARLVRQDQIHALPGYKAEQRFHGPLGELALIILNKPEEVG